MPRRLSGLIDKLSGINNKEYKSCMEKKLNRNAILLGLKVID